jgi:DNA replication protein DnaC
MQIDEILSKLSELKLFGMAEGLDSQLTTSRSAELAFEERLGLLIDCELTFRENRRLKTLLKLARLKFHADVSDIDYNSNRNISRSQIASLASCNWIGRGINVAITGPTGTGKTYLACALGHQACLKGYPTQFYKFGLLLDELEQAKIDGSLRNRLKFVNRCGLLIVDDFGIKGRLTANECEHFYEVLDGRHGGGATGATVVTSQLPTTKWHEYLSLSNPTTADALMDRLMTNVTKIELKGESLRSHKDALFD